MRGWSAACLCVMIATSGCTVRVFSPPARLLPAESVAIAPGNLIVASMEAAVHGTVFGPTLASGSLRARRTIAEGTEGVFEAHAVYVTDAANSNSHAHPVIYAFRTGAKHRLGRAAALTAGLGGGASAGGGFVSPDVGAIIAAENAYVVPFAAVRLYVSLPLAPRAVDLGLGGTMRTFDTPVTTVGMQGSVGLRIPFGRSLQAPGALLLAIGMTTMADEAENELFMSATAGVETTF